MKLQLRLRNLLFLLILCSVNLATAQQSTASRNVSTLTLRTPELNTDKKIWIYLPANYHQSRKRFPVVYMHDAQNVFDASTSYSGEWNVDETLDSINAQVIVVATEHGNEKRIDELTPFANEKYGGGNGDAYLKFIVNTLKPHVDDRYRTKKGEKHTAIFGSSLGGLISYYAVLRFPDVFGKAGVFSPSLWYSNDIFTLTEQTKNIEAKIYLMCGDSESDNMVSEQNKLVSMLDNKPGRNPKMTKSAVIKGGQHNEKLWREQFVNAYLWLFEK